MIHSELLVVLGDDGRGVRTGVKNDRVRSRRLYSRELGYHVRVARLELLFHDDFHAVLWSASL